LDRDAKSNDGNGGGAGLLNQGSGLTVAAVAAQLARQQNQGSNESFGVKTLNKAERSCTSSGASRESRAAVEAGVEVVSNSVNNSARKSSSPPKNSAVCSVDETGERN
jgi:hypothetical protein